MSRCATVEQSQAVQELKSRTSTVVSFDSETLLLSELRRASLLSVLDSSNFENLICSYGNPMQTVQRDTFKYSQAQWNRQAVKDLHICASYLNTFACSCTDSHKILKMSCCVNVRTDLICLLSVP